MRNENISYIDRVNMFKERIECDQNLWESFRHSKHRYVLITSLCVVNGDAIDVVETVKESNSPLELASFWDEEYIGGRIHTDADHFIIDLERQKVVKVIGLRL